MLVSKDKEVTRQAQRFHVLYHEVENADIKAVRKAIEETDDKQEQEFLLMIQKHIISKEQKKIIDAPFEI